MKKQSEHQGARVAMRRKREEQNLFARMPTKSQSQKSDQGTHCPLNEDRLALEI